MKKHFVTFFSPGTFVAENTTKEIESWDVQTAQAMAKGITEQYNAHPYGFQFTTRTRNENDFDSKETARSPFYFISGKIQTLAEIKAKNDPADRILISNMECNGYKRVITSLTPWKWTQPLDDDDIVLNTEGEE